MAAVTICSDFGAQKNKSDTVSPSICQEVMGPDAMILAITYTWHLKNKTNEWIKKKDPSIKQMKSEIVKEQNLVLCPKKNLWIKELKLGEIFI